MCDPAGLFGFRFGFQMLINIVHFAVNISKEILCVTKRKNSSNNFFRAEATGYVNEEDSNRAVEL